MFAILAWIFAVIVSLSTVIASFTTVSAFEKGLMTILGLGFSGIIYAIISIKEED